MPIDHLPGQHTSKINNFSAKHTDHNPQNRQKYFHVSPQYERIDSRKNQGKPWFGSYKPGSKGEIGINFAEESKGNNYLRENYDETKETRNDVNQFRGSHQVYAEYTPRHGTGYGYAYNGNHQINASPPQPYRHSEYRQSEFRNDFETSNQGARKMVNTREKALFLLKGTNHYRNYPKNVELGSPKRFG